MAIPPYSAKQDSANDDNQNEHYEKLDARIASTYAARTDSVNKNSLYDSYIRAYRWSSDRIGEKGILGFVTNSVWLDSNTAMGIRKCFAEEFSTIYIYNLRGGGVRRLGAKEVKKEGGNVFGIKTEVSIVIMIKNPDDHEKGKIYLNSIEDYLTREEKLLRVAANKSILNMDWCRIIPNERGDWVNQRDDSYTRFMRIDGKKTKEKAIFENFSSGLKTARDSWVYNSSPYNLLKNVHGMFSVYHKQLVEYQRSPETFVYDRDERHIHWNRTLEGYFRKKVNIKFDNTRVYRSIYRPYVPQICYFDKFANDMTYQLPYLYPTANIRNLSICVTGVGNKEFFCFASDKLVDLNALDAGTQCFPRYLYEKSTSKATSPKPPTGSLFEDSVEAQTAETTVDGYTRKDAITPEALAHFRAAYPGENITSDDLFYYIYGILHSEDYRTRYANNLMKELPRIPRVATYADFKAFEEAGRKLANLHINFEDIEEFKGVQIKMDKRDGFSYYVRQMKYGKIPGKTGNAAKDKTKLVYNDFITVEGIPLEAQEYVVNKRSALDWVVERACVSVDKASGIVNDFNDYAAEKNDPRYPLSLFLRVITVSLETMKIVKGLPALTIHPLDVGSDK